MRNAGASHAKGEVGTAHGGARQAASIVAARVARETASEQLLLKQFKLQSEAVEEALRRARERGVELRRRVAWRSEMRRCFPGT